MADISKISPDDGSTILNIKDKNAVHWGDQSKGYVGKNKTKNTATTTITNQVTYTVNADKSISANGTATGGDAFIIVASLNDMDLEVGKTYILSGNINDQASADSYVYLRINNGSSYIDLQSNGSKSFVYDGWSECTLRIVTKNGKSVDGTFKPMIRLASIPDSTYEPYLTPNTDLMSYADNTVLGAKNLTRRTIANGTTEKTVVVTVNSDDSVTLNGTASGGTAWIVFSNGETKLKKGTYKISGLPSTGSSSTFGLFIRPHGQSDGTDIFENDTLFNVSQDTVYDLLTPVRGNYTANNLTIKPMIRLASDTDGTYAPYAMTNRELTKICNPAIIKDITTEVRTKLGTTTYTINQAFIFKTEQKVDLDIWVVGITGGNIDWDLTGVIPKSRGRKGGIIAPRNDNPAGLTWINNNEAILCNRFSTSVDATKEYLVTISYFKQ